ncbi:MAG: hypothetical protein LLG08_08660 [Actinomycetia bacterium]|nr:hypothetical protein [Actinomycetes bacterium]
MKEGLRNPAPNPARVDAKWSWLDSGESMWLWVWVSALVGFLIAVLCSTATNGVLLLVGRTANGVVPLVLLGTRGAVLRRDKFSFAANCVAGVFAMSSLILLVEVWPVDVYYVTNQVPLVGVVGISASLTLLAAGALRLAMTSRAPLLRHGLTSMLGVGIMAALVLRIRAIPHDPFGLVTLIVVSVIAVSIVSTVSLLGALVTEGLRRALLGRSV